MSTTPRPIPVMPKSFHPIVKFEINSPYMYGLDNRGDIWQCHIHDVTPKWKLFVKSPGE